MRRLFQLLIAGLLPFAFGAAAPRADGRCTIHTFEGSTFTVCRFDTRSDELRLVLADTQNMPLRSFQRLSTQLRTDRTRVLFAMNAGMFDNAGRPIGLLVVHGSQAHALNTRDDDGNFYLKPNGVFSLEDGAVRVETTEAFAARRATPDFATQSGPMLVIDGALHSRFSADGPSKNIRNGVGIGDAHTALFAISNEPVSFGRFARLFRDELSCANALYFDGTISSAWIPSFKRKDHPAPLGPMVVVLEK